MRCGWILVVGGGEVLRKLERDFEERIGALQRELSSVSSRYRLRRRHVVRSKGKVYSYPNLYWYRWEYVAGPGGRRSVRWIYVGRSPPDLSEEERRIQEKIDDLMENHPYAKVRFRLVGDSSVLLDEESFNALREYFRGLPCFLIAGEVEP